MKRTVILTGMLLACSTGVASAADLTKNINVVPALSSCQLTFDVVRDKPTADGVSAIGGSVGVLLADDGTPIGLAKITATRGKDQIPPDTVSLATDATTNEGEVVARRLGDMPIYRLEGFVGKQTTAALTGLRETGKVSLAVRMLPDAEITFWTVDISAHRPLRGLWQACLAAIKPPAK